MKKLTAVFLSLIMTLSLCACGASAKYETAPAEAPAMMASSDSAAVYTNGTGGFAMTEEAYEMPAPEVREKGAQADTPDVDPEKIIYSADATVETTEFDESIKALTGLIEDCGGWIESSSMEGANYYNTARGNASSRSAYYTLRIPSDKFQSMMGSLSTLGNVPYTHTYTENVTAQYYDVQARLKAYQAQEERLLEMMELAVTVEDIVTIEDKLTDVRYMIDSLQTSLNNWDRRVNYSTLSLSINEVQIYTPQSVTKLSYGEELWRAFTGALKNVGQFFKDLLVFLVSAIPTLIILAALFFLLRPVIRKLRPKLQVRREERAAAKARAKAKKTGSDTKSE